MKRSKLVLLIVVILVVSIAALWRFGSPSAPILRAEHLDRTTLNPYYTEDWNLKDFKNEKLGIAIIIDSSKKTNMAWSSSSSAFNINPFDKSDTASKWLEQSKESPDGTVTVYMKKSEATFKAVIEDPKMNLYLRYIALRDMDGLNFTADQKFEFLQFTSGDPNATIRVMAMQKAGDYKPPERVIPLCCRALTDPCLMVAHGALYPLVKFFHIKDSDGKNEFETGFSYSGPPEGFDRMLRGQILYIAQSVHKIRPDLVRDDDLKLIVGTDRQ